MIDVENYQTPDLEINDELMQISDILTPPIKLNGTLESNTQYTYMALARYNVVPTTTTPSLTSSNKKIGSGDTLLSTKP